MEPIYILIGAAVALAILGIALLLSARKRSGDASERRFVKEPEPDHRTDTGRAAAEKR